MSNTIATRAANFVKKNANIVINAVNKNASRINKYITRSSGQSESDHVAFYLILFILVIGGIILIYFVATYKMKPPEQYIPPPPLTPAEIESCKNKPVDDSNPNQPKSGFLLSNKIDKIPRKCVYGYYAGNFVNTPVDTYCLMIAGVDVPGHQIYCDTPS